MNKYRHKSSGRNKRTFFSRIVKGFHLHLKSRFLNGRSKNKLLNGIYLLWTCAHTLSSRQQDPLPGNVNIIGKYI